jgi:serine/threonine-protein kinase HipA
MTSEQAYVFVDGLEAQPVICAVVTLDTTRRYGEFRYGKSYLARPDAFPLDPLNLPLSEQLYSTNAGKGVFGVLLDAGPDAWGQKVILSLHNTKPQNALQFLLAGAGMGVGALVFSLSRSASKAKHSNNTLGDLSLLLKGKDAILADQTIPAEAKKAFEYGSSMGGARPKTLITTDEHTYLAKFNRPDDLFNQVKVEHACMRMLAELPVRVASTRVVSTAHDDVLLVERFDCRHQRPTHHFISANSLMNTTTVNNAALATHYSYGFIAEYLRAQGSQPEDAHELYYRMVFNVFIGNTDDHSRNHALLYAFADQSWRLSPAYDVLPVNNSRQHGIGLGDSGRDGTVENLLSQSVRFGLKPFKAERIIAEVAALTREWPVYFRQQGVGDGDLERLKAVIPQID